MTIVTTLLVIITNMMAYLPSGWLINILSCGAGGLAFRQLWRIKNGRNTRLL